MLSRHDGVEGLHSDVHRPFTDPTCWPACSAGNNTSCCPTDLLEEARSLRMKRDGWGGGGPSLGVGSNVLWLVCLQVGPEQTW